MSARAAAFIPAVAVLLSATAAPGVELAPHRAFYTLSMLSASSEAGVTDVNGVMSFEWADSCDGWTTEQRYAMHFIRGDGTEIETATSYVTWESKNGLEYRFNVKRMTNGVETEIISGRAELESKGGAGIARFEQPGEDNIALSAGTVFPAEHTLILLDKAIAGDRFDRRLVFDGSEAKGAVPVTTIVLAQRAPDETGVLEPPLGPHPVWPMRLAFFAAEGTAGPGEELPEFELSLAMQANGIVTELTLGFGGFTVKGTLERIEALPKTDC